MTRNFKRMRLYNRGDIWPNYSWNEICFRRRLYCTDNKNTHFVFNNFGIMHRYCCWPAAMSEHYTKAVHTVRKCS